MQMHVGLQATHFGHDGQPIQLPHCSRWLTHGALCPYPYAPVSDPRPGLRRVDGATRSLFPSALSPVVTICALIWLCSVCWSLRNAPIHSSALKRQLLGSSIEIPALSEANLSSPLAQNSPISPAPRCGHALCPHFEPSLNRVA